MNPGTGDVPFDTLQSFGERPGQRLGARPLQRFGLQPEVGATRPTPAPRGPTAPPSLARRHNLVNCGAHKAPSCARCPQGNG